MSVVDIMKMFFWGRWSFWFLIRKGVFEKIFIYCVWVIYDVGIVFCGVGFLGDWRRGYFGGF